MLDRIAYWTCAWIIWIGAAPLLVMPMFPFVFPGVPAPTHAAMWPWAIDLGTMLALCHYIISKRRRIVGYFLPRALAWSASWLDPENDPENVGTIWRRALVATIISVVCTTIFLNMFTELIRSGLLG